MINMAARHVLFPVLRHEQSTLLADGIRLSVGYKKGNDITEY